MKKVRYIWESIESMRVTSDNVYDVIEFIPGSTPFNNIVKIINDDGIAMVYHMNGWHQVYFIDVTIKYRSGIINSIMGE